MRTLRFVVFLAVASLPLIGCPAPDEKADAGAADAGPTGESYTFKVLKVTAFRPEVVKAVANGATVSFDRPDGTTVEATTDSQGTATIDGVVWSGTARAASCVYAADHQIACFAGYAQSDLEAAKSADGSVEVTLWPLTDPSPQSMVTISGTALHMTPGNIYITSLQGTDLYQAYGASWSFSVPTGRPLTLIALNWIENDLPSGERVSETFEHWAVVEHEAVTADHEIVIDFDASATPTHFSGSVLAPPGASGTFFHDAKAYLIVKDAAAFGAEGTEQNDAALGGVYYTRRSSDGNSFEYEGEYLTLPGVTLATEFSLYRERANSAGRDWLFWWETGNPTSGPHSFDLVAPPTLVAPQPYVASGLGDEIVWLPGDGASGQPDAQLHIWLFRGDQILWHVAMPPNTTRIVLPTLPSTISRTAVFGTDLLVGSLLMNEVDSTTGNLLWQSQAESFTVQP